MVNRRTTNSEGDWVDAEPTAWTAKVWGSAAQNVVDSLSKGDRVLITGAITTDTWTDKDTGDKRFRNVVNVDEIGVSLTWATARPEKSTIPATGETSTQ